jgi:hypothetical protein
MRPPRIVLVVSFFIVGGLVLACEGPKPAPPPPCDQACQDGVALRSVREILKLAYNLTLQGKDVGTQDARLPCLRGGTAHVFGEASSNAIQGTTDLKLTYELDKCSYLQQSGDPKQSYDVTVTGTIEENGTIAASAGATTALILKSPSVTVTGTVYDPPITYAANECALEVAQNGSHLGGDFCGRKAGLDF